MTGSPSRLFVTRVAAQHAAATMEHLRLMSQSTVSSCSLSSKNDLLHLQSSKGRRQLSVKGRKTLKPPICRKKGGIPRNSIRADIQLTRTPGGKGTPAARSSIACRGTPGSKVRRKPAALFCSPGGTDYIITPGRHKISVSEFISEIDLRQTAYGCAASQATVHYQESMLRIWLVREQQIDRNIYLLSFKEGSALEQFRQMAVHSVYQYAVNQQLHEKTVHLACFNISRLIYTRLINQSDAVLTHSLFASLVVMSLRHAIKNDESFEKSELFRINPGHVWTTCSYLKDAAKDKSESYLNKLEAECLPILEFPANPPLCPEFLDRYIGVGEWPQYQQQYRDLASYLLGLAQFANTCGNALRCVPHSKLAAAALVLAIKVINTDHNTTKYEYWPMRLEQYTGLCMEDLKPVIRGLANLLRHKPRWSQILERFYGKWSEYDWN